MNNPRLLKFPFCDKGIKNNIPDNRIDAVKPELASIEDGFPPVTMSPKASGGLPPHGKDFNGIFNLFSQHIVFLSKGGRYKFDADYATAIDGYPKGSILMSDDDSAQYISTKDRNTTNFNNTISSDWEKTSWGMEVNKFEQMIGIPVPFPSSVIPKGYVAMMGQAINAKEAPVLARLYGECLPDLRGEFIRGWDNGRGIDAARKLLSIQLSAIKNIYTTLNVAGRGALNPSNYDFSGLVTKLTRDRAADDFQPASLQNWCNTMHLDFSRVTDTTPHETRPRNVAFNYICLIG